MEKQDLVIGNKYYLDTLEVEFFGEDQRNEGRVLLIPLNEETVEFYNFNDDGLVSLAEWIFLECFKPQN